MFRLLAPKQFQYSEVYMRIPVEVYSRVVGYFRPVSQWNLGKKEEFRNRRTFLYEDNKSKVD